MHISWTFALASLARIETDSIRAFFQETDQHFQGKLSKLHAEVGDDASVTDDEIDAFVDVRDELEGFAQLDRYFAIVQAHAVAERIFARIVESAIDYGLISKSRVLSGHRFVNATAVKNGFRELKISLPEDDLEALNRLRRQRNIILHSGGWYESPEKREGKLAATLRLEFTTSDVESALNLAHRSAVAAVAQYRGILTREAAAQTTAQPATGFAANDAIKRNSTIASL